MLSSIFDTIFLIYLKNSIEFIYMDTLRVGRNNIFPESISDISMVNEDSEFAESLNQKSEKNYQIKINGQESMSNINTS